MALGFTPLRVPDLAFVGFAVGGAELGVLHGGLAGDGVAWIAARLALFAVV